MTDAPPMPQQSKKKTQILILGGGFAGCYAAMRLDKTLARRDDCEVTLVDRDNFLLFTPMLHEVAASDLDPSDIVMPLRKVLKHVAFYEGLVESIDLDAKRVEFSYGFPRKRRTLTYDQVVITLGSSTKFFDEQTATNAVELKTLGDAFFLRNRMIGILESAAVEEDAEQRRRLLTFAIAGGGFTGVESAGAMFDFLHEAIDYYPRLDKAMVRILLIHPHDVLLPEFSQKLGKYTERKLREYGIEVVLNTKVKTYDGQVVSLSDGQEIAAGTLLWTAGVTPDRVVESLPLTKVKGRLKVDSFMRSVDRPEVWALGDCAAVPEPDDKGEKPYPATAQTAIRMGPAVAKNIEAVVLGEGRQLKPFKFKLLGQLAAIGQRRGTAEVFGFRFSGFLAWWMWRTIYLAKLPGVEKKVRVLVDWTLDLFFSRDLVQIFTVKDVQRITAFGIRNKLGPTHEAAPATGHSDRRPDGDHPDADHMSSPGDDGPGDIHDSNGKAHDGPDERVVSRREADPASVA